MTPVIVVHYHEIALKGENRERFERQLIAHIRRALSGVTGVRVARMSGRIAVRCDSRQPVPTGASGPTAPTLGPGQADSRQLVERMLHVFGIASIGVGYEVRQDRDGLAEDVVSVVRRHCEPRRERVAFLRGRLREAISAVEIAASPEPALSEQSESNGAPRNDSKTFAVRVKRGNKRYPMTSQDLERELGATIVDTIGLRVDLEHPELTVGVELVEDTAFVLLERVTGPGGLPTGSAGRVVVLLSSGFDSPVAAWRLMKRGAEAILIHFHSAPYTSDASVRNVEDIARVLAAWQGQTALVTVPLIEYQKAVMVGAPHALRVLLYRRAMVRVAERVAVDVGAGALVTGESLGQVASQTLANIGVVDASATLPILRPLIGYDKQEIIDAAEAIGTAEIARRPYDDCCSLFVPAHPATAARLADVERVESALSFEEWVPKLFDQRAITAIDAPAA